MQACKAESPLIILQQADIFGMQISSMQKPDTFLSPHYQPNT